MRGRTVYEFGGWFSDSYMSSDLNPLAGMLTGERGEIRTLGVVRDPPLTKQLLGCFPVLTAQFRHFRGLTHPSHAGGCLTPL